MRLLIKFARTYPLDSAIMLLALVLAGIAEGVGFSALLPLLGIALGGGAGVSSAADPAKSSAAERLINESLSYLGIRPTLETLLVLVFLAILLKSGFILIANKRVGYTIAHVATDMRIALLRALLNSRWEFHLRQPVGKLANAMSTEVTMGCKAFSCGAKVMLFFIQALVAVIVAFMISWQATLTALVAEVLIFLAMGGLIRKAKRSGWRQTNLMKSLASLLTDCLQSIKPLKSMAREKSAEAVLIQKTGRLNRALQKQVLSQELLRAFQEPLQMVFLLTGLFVALKYFSLAGTTVMVLIYLIARLLNQLNKVQQEYQRMAIFESGYWSLQDTIRQAAAASEMLQGERLHGFDSAIRLDHVSFAYSEKNVLQDISLTFPKGRITAIVGPSGSGKTTIVDLVTGLLQPQQGVVYIDDTPLAQVDLRSWRKMIGYVPQESILLHDTILNNIILGDPDLNEDDAVNALRAAGAWEFVKGMPEGMHSSVGERGGALSGGQRQRIAIARALVHRPRLLILDEATTGLDPESENAICNTLRQLRGELTLMAISHQPALVKIADKVYRVQDGTILARQDRAANDADISMLNPVKPSAANSIGS